jgi:hypothetical protein
VPQQFAPGIIADTLRGLREISRKVFDSIGTDKAILEGMMAVSLANHIDATDKLYSPGVIAQVWLGFHTSIMSLLENSNPPITGQEIAQWFRKGGLPIAVIAQIVRVERKSVYAWMDGGHIRPQNQKRIEQLYALLSGYGQEDLISLYRFWKRQLSSGQSLGDLLIEENLNVRAIQKALSELRPLVKKAKQMANTNHDRDLKKNNLFLEEIPEIIIPDEH